MTANLALEEDLECLNKKIVELVEEHGSSLFPHAIGRYVKPGKTGAKLVKLALASDCARTISDAFHRFSINRDCNAAKWALKVISDSRKEYRSIVSDTTSAFEFFEQDRQPFGFLHEKSRWSGMECCARADEYKESPGLLLQYRLAFQNWFAIHEIEFDVMQLPEFGITYSKCRGPNVQLRPNVVCKMLENSDEPKNRVESRIPALARRIAYWELLEFNRENPLQFGSALRQNLTPLQRLQLEKYLDPGRQVRHLWPEESGDGFSPYPRSFVESPFDQEARFDARPIKNRSEKAETIPADEDIPIPSERGALKVVEHAKEDRLVAAIPGVSTPQKVTEMQLGPAADEEKAAVVEAPLGSNILVFAPPGTGKTYALIKRLAHLIASGQITNPANEVLVLSFSRAAVAEIIKRICEEAELTGDNNLRYVQIRTFDSFAARSLTIGQNPVPLTGSYEKNIRKFTNLLVADELPEEANDNINEVRFLVVDEIQDLVGERAQMTYELTRKVAENNGAVFLLGDPAQAIYDWQLKDGDEWTAAEFLSRTTKLLDESSHGLMQRSFHHYHRFECQYLEQFVKSCRVAVGTDGTAPDVVGIRNLIGGFATAIPEETLHDIGVSPEQTAVLTRNNLEAYQLSKWCGNNAINHRVERGASGRYWPGWIGRSCYGFQQSTMSIDMFRRRWAKLVSENERSDVDSAIQFLSEHGVVASGQIDVEGLSQLVDKSQPTQLWPNDEDCHVTVSTIHRSKGLQFDRVVLLEPEPGNFHGGERSSDAENARVIYVSATRAKSRLQRLMRNRSLFKRGLKKCSRKSWNRLKHFQVWDGAAKSNQFLLDGTDEFDLIDLMKTIKSPRYKELHEQLWKSRSLSTNLEIERSGDAWRWNLNGIDFCNVSYELGYSLNTFDAFLEYKEFQMTGLATVPIVDIASVSFAWTGDSELEKQLGKARLGLVPVVYGLATVKKKIDGQVPLETW